MRNLFKSSALTITAMPELITKYITLASDNDCGLINYV